MLCSVKSQTRELSRNAKWRSSCRRVSAHFHISKNTTSTSTLAIINEFEHFSQMIRDKLDVLIMAETKLYSSFQERCIQNVCTPFPLLHENHIFNNYRVSTPNHSHTVTGTVCTECVYTVPLAT